MPTDWVLKQIAFAPPPSAFQPYTTPNGDLRPPAISVRNQARIRKACLLADLDPTLVVGLPEKEDGNVRYKLKKGDGREIKAFKRQLKIEENMSKMAERISTWKEEKRKERKSKIPDMPF
ncbi:hypothetical protein HDV05_007903 [Chytridiales sp. JEL 0842]|nr:hypothetical protein HDV05_007903 [Chytridiales sp. JEL 0842]